MPSEKLTTPNWLICGFEVKAFVRNLVIPQGVGRVCRPWGTICYASLHVNQRRRVNYNKPNVLSLLDDKQDDCCVSFIKRCDLLSRKSQPFSLIIFCVAIFQKFR